MILKFFIYKNNFKIFFFEIIYIKKLMQTLQNKQEQLIIN